MAYIKTNWVNNETELNAENMNHIEEGIDNLQNVELIAVSSEAPLECSVGDKYYNIIDDKIYTAIETDAWETIGEDAKKGIFYLVFDEESIYSYDGETMISVGAGGNVGGGSLLIGTIVPYTGNTIPDGYLLCDGSAINRREYAMLFDIIGTTYGAGDGSTTFNLPNLKGRVITGQDTSQTEFDTLGELGGSKYLQEHNHELREAEDKNFKGFVTTAYSGATGWRVSQDSAVNSGGELLYNYTKNTGTGDSGNLQPYIVLKYIIKATKEQDGSTLSESLPVGTELDFDGTTSEIPEGWEEINNPESYSTTEVKTNKTWIDGKPIYKKVYTVSQPATENWTVIDFSTVGLSNIDYIYFANGSRKLESARYVRDYDYNQNVYLDMTQLKLQIGPTENPQQFTFVFEYTKTTD